MLILFAFLLKITLYFDLVCPIWHNYTIFCSGVPYLATYIFFKYRVVICLLLFRSTITLCNYKRLNDFLFFRNYFFLLFLEFHLPIDIRALRPIVISFLLKEESTITTKTTTTTTIITSSLILGIRTVQEISAFTLEHFRRPLHHLLPRELHGNGGGNSVTFLSIFIISFKPNSLKRIS